MPFRFRVYGRVHEAGSDRPLPGLTVRAFDKDLVNDDELGAATAGPDGRFEIVFTELDFRDAFERRPDLYFRVYDASGSRELHSTLDRVVWDAKGDEDVTIAVPRAALAPRGRP